MCGTTGGHRKHYDKGEKPCDACRDAKNAAARKRYQEKKELISAQAHASYMRHRDKRLANAHAWRAANPDKIKSHKQKRRATQAKVRTEPYTIQQVIDTYGSNCHICQEPIDLNAPRHSMQGKGWEHGLHIDHVVSIFNDGSDTIDNVKPAHAICNLRKGIK